MKRKEQAIAYIEKQKENYIVLRNNLDKRMKNYKTLKRQCTDIINLFDYILLNLY